MAIHVAKGADTYTATITGGSANTKGSWTELLASTAEDIGELRINVVSSNASQTFLLDIGTGAGGSESVLVSNVLVSANVNIRASLPVISLPVNIPSGTRVAARVQSSAGSSNAVRLSVMLIGGTVSPAAPVTYGAVTASSTGTTIEPGAVADTKGSYVQVTASTSADHDWLVVVFSGRANASPASAFWVVDVATGGSGSESVVIPNLCFASGATATAWTPMAVAFPLSVSSGTRLAVRAACSTTDPTDRLFDVELIGAKLAPAGGGPSAVTFIG